MICGVRTFFTGIEVVDEQGDGGSGEGSAHADVVQFPVDAQGELAVFVDAVVSDAVVGVAAAVGGGDGFGAGLVGRGRGRAVWKGAVGTPALQ